LPPKIRKALFAHCPPGLETSAHTASLHNTDYDM
jgi:hypothetical protein